MNYAKTIDHTKLGLRVNTKQLEQLTNEAKEFGFFSVCIPPCYITQAKKLLKGSAVKVCTVISFPHGNDTTEAKVFMAKDAIKKGADEVDMVMNVGFFLDERYAEVQEEIRLIKKACGKKVLKVIIETSALTDEQILKASEIVMNAGADFVKTSTGFDTRGANANDVKLMKQAVGDKILIKASGGVKTLSDLEEYIKLGASRIGASKGVEIIKGENNGDASY